MSNAVEPLSIEEITGYYEAAFLKFSGKRRKNIDVTFYPYVGLNHTIRVRSGKVLIRISEVCRTMSGSGHEALAEILVAKLLNKRVPKSANEAYNHSIKAEDIQEKNTHVKKTRGRKVLTGSKGDVYDLDEMFEEINREYFRGVIPKPTMTWSLRKTYSILGHHDATHDTIVISRSLDSLKVPRFIVRYVVFHEMLHIYHPTKVINGKRFNHTPEFKRDERRFKEYKAAERWIEDNVSKLKWRAKRDR